MLVDGRGVPLGVAVDGANVSDQKLVAATLDGIPVKRPKPTPQAPQHLCLDKSYAGAPVDRTVRNRGYEPHVPRKAADQSSPAPAQTCRVRERHRGNSKNCWSHW